MVNGDVVRRSSSSKNDPKDPKNVVNLPAKSLNSTDSSVDTLVSHFQFYKTRRVN